MMSRLNVSFTNTAFSDYEEWALKDKKIFKKINQLIKSINREGAMSGIGKPEKLVGNYSGYYSRRITQEHRLVYIIDQEKITIISCKYHYSK